MKFLPIYQTKYSLLDSDQVFKYLTDNLTNSIIYWDYFVNWNKVRNNIQGLEIDLNTLNYLVGKDRIEDEFKILLAQYPSVARLIPLLLAYREKNLNILTSFIGGQLEYENFSFEFKGQLTPSEINKICRFAKETGLLEIFQKKIVSSIPDYVTGIEVGLDSHGRKNRGGTAMERIVESFLKIVCEKYGFAYLPQATSEKIYTLWGINLQVDKSDRRFDFAVKQSDKIFLIETNYFGGGGSKLKATAGEYKSLFDFVTSYGYGFVWITDGLGWKKTLLPLEEAFVKLDYILNLKMVTDGILNEILLNW